MRFSQDLTTEDFTCLDPERTVALLPVGAFLTIAEGSEVQAGQVQTFGRGTSVRPRGGDDPFFQVPAVFDFRRGRQSATVLSSLGLER